MCLQLAFISVIMLIKFFFILSLFIGFTYLQGVNLTLGDCTDVTSSELLFGTVFQDRAIQMFAYNKSFLYYGNTIITCISALSNLTNTSAILGSGGVGQAYASVRLMSNYSTAISYNLTIYGSGACSASLPSDVSNSK